MIRIPTAPPRVESAEIPATDLAAFNARLHDERWCLLTSAPITLTIDGQRVAGYAVTYGPKR